MYLEIKYMTIIFALLVRGSSKTKFLINGRAMNALPPPLELPFLNGTVIKFFSYLYFLRLLQGKKTKVV